MSFKSLVLALVILFSSNVFASSHTYTAWFSCENQYSTNAPLGNYPIHSCMETLKLTNFGKVEIYKGLFRQFPFYTASGNKIYIELSKKFVIRTQNTQEGANLRLVILDKWGDVVYEDVASKWGVLAVTN